MLLELVVIVSDARVDHLLKGVGEIREMFHKERRQGRASKVLSYLLSDEASLHCIVGISFHDEHSHTFEK